MKISSILIICILCSLSACGFKLYSKEELPPQLHTLYLQSDNPYGQFETDLKHSFKTMGINFTDLQTQAPITLKIINTNFSHDNLNTVSSSQATVYNFTYNVTFNLLNSQDKSIISPQTVKSSRTLTLNPNEVIDANPEVDTIKQEMHRELIFKILNRLSSKNTQRALKMINKKA
jgi:outer membrane lipopolysaccharide assembly protein LptE/RlpB